MQANKSSY